MGKAKGEGTLDFIFCQTPKRLGVKNYRGFYPPKFEAKIVKKGEKDKVVWTRSRNVVFLVTFFILCWS